MTVKETHIVPFTGSDGGYRVFLGMTDPAGKPYHALAWVKTFNSKASEFQEAVMQDIRVHKDGPAGRWLPYVGMTESQVYCTVHTITQTALTTMATICSSYMTADAQWSTSGATQTGSRQCKFEE
jgi:hypothetical protein